MKPLLLVPSLAIIAGLSAADGLPELVPLVLANCGKQQTETQHVEIQNGAGTMPFATADGQLRIAKRDDGWLFDRNGDGKLDDADLPVVKQKGTFSVPVTISGKSQAVELTLSRVYEYSQFTQLIISGSTALVATVGDQRIWIIDDNLDGRFDQIGLDEMAVSPAADPPGVRTKLGSKVLALGDRLAEYVVVDQGAALTLKAWAGAVATVTCELAPPAGRDSPTAKSASITLRHADGLMDLTLVPGKAMTAVPGIYQVKSEDIKIAIPGQPADATVDLQGIGPFGSVTLAAGANVVKRGAPDHLVYSAVISEPGTVVVDSVALADAHGGRWRPVQGRGDLRSGPPPEGKIACLAKSGADEKELGTVGYEGRGGLSRNSVRVPDSFKDKADTCFIVRFSAKGFPTLEGSKTLVDLAKAKPSPNAVRIMADNAQYAGNIDKAVSIYKDALVDQPDNIGLLYNFSEFLIALPKHRRCTDTAVTVTRHLMEVGSHSQWAVHIRLLLVEALLQGGKLDQARSEIDIGLKAEPSNKKLKDFATRLQAAEQKDKF